MDDFNVTCAAFGIRRITGRLSLLTTCRPKARLAQAQSWAFSIDLMPGTRVDLTPTADGVIAGRVFGSDGKSLQDYSAGFTVDGKGYQ